MDSEPQDERTSDEPAVAVAPRRSGSTFRDALRARRGGLLVAGLVAMVGGIVALVMLNFNDSTMYEKTVDQIMVDKSKWVGRNVRVEGLLVKGTLVFREKPCEYRFDATKNGQTIHVRYPSCIKPDTLRDDMPEQISVTAEGKLTDSGDFNATNVLAKCPSKYEMKEKAQQGYPGTAPSAFGYPPASGPPAVIR